MTPFRWFREFISRKLPGAAQYLVDPGAVSVTGVSLSYESALTLSTVWRAVNLLSDDLARLPLNTFRREGRGKVAASEHPAYRLLKHRANAQLTSHQFRKLLQSQVLLHGNGYAWIVRTQEGNPSALIPLSPTATRARRPTDSPEDLIYETQVRGETIRFDWRDVLHIKGLSDTGLDGHSVIRKARDSIGLGVAQQQYAGSFFRNNAVPAAVLRHPGHLSDDASDHLRRSLEKFQNAANQHKVMILEEGIEIHPVSMSHEDAQFLESREFQVKDIANWFGVPPHKLGSTEGTKSFASVAESNQEYLDQALSPWLTAWESECWHKLLTIPQQDRDTHLIEFDTRALTRADIETRFTAYGQAIKDGWMSRNEVRAAENLPEIDGLDEFFVPVNQVEPMEASSRQLQLPSQNGIRPGSTNSVNTFSKTSEALRWS